MAKKTPGKGQWTANNGNMDAKYAQCDLTEADKPAFVAWLKGVSQDFPTVLLAVMAEGYRITFKTDFNNGCEQVTFTQQDPKHHNFGIILVSRSDDPEEAFWLNVYKTHVLYEGQRLPTQSERAFWG